MVANHEAIRGDAAATTARMRRIPLFSDLPAEALAALAGRVDSRTYRPGDIIARAGDPAEKMFVIDSGSVKITRTRDGASVTVAHLCEGEFFGEVAILAGRPRSSTIVAVEPTVLVEVSRAVLDDVTREHASVERLLLRCYLDRMLDNLTRSSPLFTTFSAENRRRFVDHFSRITVEANTDILSEGQEPDGLYVMLSGDAVVSRVQDGQRVAVGALESGDTFGEMSLLEDRPVRSRIRTTRESVVLRLPRPIFEVIARTHPAFVDHLRALGARRVREADAALDERAVTRVRELMTTGVHTVSPDTSMKRCLHIMREERISCVVVCVGRVPVDILSERDLVSILQMGLDADALTKRSPANLLGARAPLTAPAEQPVDQTLAVMLANGAHQVLVVDAEGRLLGIVTQTNLLEYCAQVLIGVLNADRALESAYLQLKTAPKGALELLARAQRELHCA